MNTEWSLKELYTGIDAPEYEADIRKAEENVEKLSLFLKDVEGKDWLQKAEGLLELLEEVQDSLLKVLLYVELRQAVDTEDGDLMAQQNRLMRIYAKMTPLEAAAKKILTGIPHEETLTEQNHIENEKTKLLK